MKTEETILEALNGWAVLSCVVVYPFLANGLFAGDAHLAGLFLGTAIHDTAQVAGAGCAWTSD